MDQFIIIKSQELEALIERSLKKALTEAPLEKVKEVPEVMNAAEAAQFLNISLSALYNKTSKRQIPHAKPGKRLYFNKTELLRWIENNKKLTQDEVIQQGVLFRNNKINSRSRRK